MFYKNEKLVIVRIWEGLGNQLFQYAYARFLAERGLNVRLDLNKAYDHTFKKNRNHYQRQNSIQSFNISLLDINVEEYGKYRYIERDSMKDNLVFYLARHGLWKYRYYEETKHFYTEKAAKIKGNCYIKGLFQDEKYFKHLRQILLKELTPGKKIRISKELRQAMENKESVAVHIRRGDYVKIHQALPVAYYYKAIALIKNHYQNPQFLIFSDDLDWVKENLKIEDKCIYVNEDRKLQDYEELMIMSRCKSNIISNSTFSWWGAWLNRNPEKIIIASKSCWLSKQENMILL